MFIYSKNQRGFFQIFRMGHIGSDIHVFGYGERAEYRGKCNEDKYHT